MLPYGQERNAFEFCMEPQCLTDPGEGYKKDVFVWRGLFTKT